MSNVVSWPWSECGAALAEVSFSTTAPSVRTSVITVAAAREVVFNTLADIEALPRWAGGFCEQVYLHGGRWRALTSLGELWLELEVDAREGSFALLGGWEPTDIRRVSWRVMASPADATRVVMRIETTTDELQQRLARAVETELWGLAGRWGGGVLMDGAERAG